MSKNKARSPQDTLKEPYARLLTPAEDGTYTAEILEFSGCYAEGDTAAEAIANLENAAISWIEAAIEQGQEIPPPMDVYEYSGRINLRLPKSIHKQAARFAAKDDVSLNGFFACAIAARVGAEELYERLARNLESRLPFAIAIVNVEYSSAILFPMQSSETRLQYLSTEAILDKPPQLPVEAKKVFANG